MEPRKPPEFNLDITTDRSSAKDVVKAILHIIFFHRYFTPLTPATHEVLDLTLPYTTDPSIESLIEARSTSLTRSLAPSVPCTLTLQFLERKRRKTWFVASASEETVWETWNIDVRLGSVGKREMEVALQRCAMKVLGIVGRERGHIPPITTNESNPFPYRILPE